MIENKEQKEYLEMIMTQIESGKVLSEIVSGHNSKIKRLLFEECGERGRKALILDFERTTPIFKILELYNNGFMLEEVDKELGITMGKSTNLIAEYELLTGKNFRHLYSGIRYDLDEDEIIEEYRSGKTIEQTAIENECSAMPIQKRINEYMAENGDELKREHDYNFELLRLSRIPPKKEEHKEKKKKVRYVVTRIQLDSEEIYLRYANEKISLKQLAKEYNVSATTIRNRIKEYIMEHDIKEEVEDSKPAKKIKIATRYSILNILSKYNYTYEELSKVALEAGYLVQRDVYDSVIEELNKQRKGEDR